MKIKAAPKAAAAQRPPGRVITFYSYKGGTGRTMLLANVAFILASAGKRVLVVDWDLEAPGLHRYLHPFLVDPEVASSPGVIDMVIDYASEAMTEVDPDAAEEFQSANILRFAASLRFPFQAPGTLDFVPAGRQGPSYAARVNSFNWQDFYDRFGGGSFLEAIKSGMRKEYDYVLLDSRTGVSDTSGICTVQLPDALVVCFTLNDQSIEGASAIAASVRAQRGEEGFHIYPVPTRVEDGEKKKLEAARDVARAKFAEFLTHVAPARRDEYWGDVEVPYKVFYAYEEILAVFGDRPRQPTSMLAAAERLTKHLTRGEVTHLAPVEEEDRLRWLASFERGRKATAVERPSARPAPSPGALPGVPAREPPPWRTWLGGGVGVLLATIVIAQATVSAQKCQSSATPDAGVVVPSSEEAGAPNTANAANAVVAAAQTTKDPLVRLLLLADLSPLDPEPEGARALIEDLAAHPVPAAVLRGDASTTLGARFAAADKVVVVKPDGIRIWPADGHGDPAAIQLKADTGPLIGSRISVFDVAGDVLTAGTADGFYGLWPVSGDVEPPHLRKTSSGVVGNIRLSPSGKAWLRAFGNRIYLRTVTKGPKSLEADEPSKKKKDIETPAPVVDAAIGDVDEPDKVTGAGLIVTVSPARVDVWRYTADGLGEQSVDTKTQVWSSKEERTVKVAFDAGLSSVVLASSTGAMVGFRIDPKGKLGNRVSFGPPMGSLGALAVSGDQCAASSAGAVWTWSWSAPTEPHRVGIHAGPVQSLAFSPDRTRLLSAADDGIAKVFKIDPGGTSDPVELRGSGLPLTGASWSADAERVVTVLANNNNDVWVWRLKSGIPTGGSFADMVRALKSVTSACLPAEVRKDLLMEAPMAAQTRWSDCEKDKGRSPSLTPLRAPR